MDEPERNEPHERALSRTASPADVFRYRAPHFSVVRLLGTRHLAPWISLRTKIPRRRGTQYPAHQRLDLHHAVWRLSRICQLWMAGGSLRPKAHVFRVRAGSRDTHAHLWNDSALGRREFRDLAARHRAAHRLLRHRILRVVRRHAV